jgi:hypothetical protein
MAICLIEQDVALQLNFDDIIHHFAEVKAKKKDFKDGFFIILLNSILCLYLLLLICVHSLVSN